MLCSRFVFICMIPGSLTLQLSNGYSIMFEALFTLVFCCYCLLRLMYGSTLMPTRQVVRIHASLPRAMLCFLLTISSPGPRSVRTPSPDRVLKLSIARWLMMSPRPHGCANSFRSSAHLSVAPRWRQHQCSLHVLQRSPASAH